MFGVSVPSINLSVHEVYLDLNIPNRNLILNFPNVNLESCSREARNGLTPTVDELAPNPNPSAITLSRIDREPGMAVRG